MTERLKKHLHTQISAYRTLSCINYGILILLVHITTAFSDESNEIEKSPNQLDVPLCTGNISTCDFTSSSLSVAQNQNTDTLSSEKITSQDRANVIRFSSSDETQENTYLEGHLENESTIEEDGDQQFIEDAAEKIFDCIFSTIPYIGGKWLTKVARKRVSDDMLLEASHSFLDGGKWILKFIDLKTRSPAVTLFDNIDLCFDEDRYSKQDFNHNNQFTDTINDHNNDSGKRKISQMSGKGKKSSSTLLSYHRKRRLARSSGYGVDSLLGFTVLGCLVVGALIAWLIYLLT